MSKMKNAFLTVFGFALFASPVFADFSIDELVEATKIALKDFKTTEHAAHFTGYKVWKSGEDSKVKVYVNHHGMTMEFNYTCRKVEASIQCQAE